MAQPMDKRAEERIVSACRDISQLVEEGAHPTDAVTKIASDYGFEAGMVPLLVHSFNVGRSTYQREHGGRSILDKHASFPLAVLEDVMSRLYDPSPAPQRKAASAVSPEYNAPPDVMPSDERMFMEKSAEVNIRYEPSTNGRTPSLSWLDREGQEQRYYGDVTIKAAKAQSDVRAHKRAVDAAGHRYRVAKENFMAALGAVGEYFKQSSYFRKPFAEVAYNSKLLFGSPAQHVLDYAYDTRGLKEKRAAAAPTLLSPARKEEVPYSLIKRAIDKGAEVIRMYKEFKQTEKAAAAAQEDAMAPFEQNLLDYPPPRTQYSVLTGSHAPFSEETKRAQSSKEAGLLDTALGFAGGRFSRSSLGQDKPDLVEDAASELSDPSHLNEMRQIQARAMLQDFLHNDEIISGYDPEEVVAAYNEVAQLTPRSSTQAAVMRPLLRQRLTQGAMQPFEAEQIANIEKTLGQGQQPLQRNPQQQQQKQSSEVLRGNPILA